jgi:hypothetical protein
MFLQNSGNHIQDSITNHTATIIIYDASVQQEPDDASLIMMFSLDKSCHVFLACFPEEMKNSCEADASIRQITLFSRHM